MDLNEFKNVIKVLSNINDVLFTDEQINKLYKYIQLLIDWNNNINLTAITNEEDIILKHFIDSAVVNRYLANAECLIDVGTGAGFPGLVLKITNPDLNVTLLDALNKRVNFLNEVILEDSLENIVALHGRAEEFGQDMQHREQYDVVVSRAVANMNVLLEYMMPFVKVNGLCICMKSVSVNEEIENAKNVINLLGGQLESIDKIYLKDKNNEVLERDIVIIRKVTPTDNIYPRNSKKINKKPLA